MKKLVCMLLFLGFIFTAVMPASAEVVMKEYPWGINYYSAEVLTKEVPRVQCAVDGNCEEISDPCLLDNSCTKLLSCVNSTSALYDNGLNTWTQLKGGGLDCDYLLFHGMTPIEGQGNEEQGSIEECGDTTQHGAIVTMDHKERKSRH